MGTRPPFQAHAHCVRNTGVSYKWSLRHHERMAEAQSQLTSPNVTGGHIASVCIRVG